jgi:glycerol-3-phosphate acyltransferase PlsY
MRAIPVGIAAFLCCPGTLIRTQARPLEPIQEEVSWTEDLPLAQSGLPLAWKEFTLITLSPMLPAVVAAVVAYLMGSLSFAVIVSRAMGLTDPRAYGSGNPGATNVLRSGNKAAAAVTLLFDVAKGWLPVVLVQLLGPRYGLGEGAQAIAGLAAFLGHLWPVFFRFQGGKGVATALGVLLAFSPWLGLAVLAVWIVLVLVTRYSSLAAVITAVLAPVCAGLGDSLWSNAPWRWDAQGARLLAVIVMALLLLWRHRGNIARLVAGEESKVGAGKKTP